MTAPNPPAASVVHPLVAGYLLATLETHGSISVDAWNKALSLAPRPTTR